MINLVELGVTVTEDTGESKIRQFNAVNLEKEYKTIAIYSPMEVTTYVSENG